MMHAHSIEYATRADAALLSEIHRGAFPPNEAWSRDVFILQLDLPATFALIAPSRGMILARVAADEAEILTLAVLPDHRRRGLGAALLRTAMARAEALGAAAMYLEVAVPNAAARALYTVFGFSEAGLRRRYYNDGTDALVLRSALPPG